MRAAGAKRAVELTLFGVVAILLGGCSIGSVEYVHSGTYRGRVLDAQNRTTVQGAKVELLSTLKASSESDSTGYFLVGPLKCSHFGIAYYPEGTSFQCEHSTGINLLLKLSKAGYAPLEVLVPAHYNITNWSSGRHFGVGTLLLQPQPTTSQ